MSSSHYGLCMELLYLYLFFSLQWQRREPLLGQLLHQHFWTREGNFSGFRNSYNVAVFFQYLM